jgi:hypothetical protein
MGWFRLTVLAMPCKPLQAGLLQSGLAIHDRVLERVPARLAERGRRAGR